MALLAPNILRSIVNAHGQRPYDVIVEFQGDQRPLFSAFNSGGWKERPVNAQQLSFGYGAEPFAFSFTTWDPDSVEAEHMGTNLKGKLLIPKDGEWVCVTVKDQTAPNGRVMFRGMVRSVHERILDAGKQYQVEAISDIVRLNNVHVTFQANFHNDPVNPSPRFDNSGGLLLVSRLKTVYEIAQDIMNFKDAFNTDEFFEFGDIDWNGLDTDPRCGQYVPTTLTFQDTPKGKALEDLLSRAGNYTFVFVPSRDGRCKIRLVELNLDCNRCGLKWDINYAPTNRTAQTLQKNYAFDYALGEDNTEWNSKESANVVRVTTAPIRFYTGNWLIPEILDGDNLKNVSKLENDSILAQQYRAVSLDGANYRFTFLYDNAQDNRKLKYYPVGLPLYPDWNIHEDHLPAFLEIQDAQIPPSGAATGLGGLGPMTPDKYKRLVEYQSFTIGDEVNRGTPRVRHINNLRTYQAWYARKQCPACTPGGSPADRPGLGLVEKVYDNADNEPVLEWSFINASGVRRVATSATDVPLAGERMTFTVKNYIFDPKNFGVPSIGPSGLTAWSGATTFNGGTSSYPLPWKNLCPYCRGTGMKPEFKIRSIDPSLFAGRNNQINQPSGVNEIPVDSDFTQTGPETWEQTQNRLAMKETAWVAVEVPLLKPQLPTFGFRNMKWDDLKKKPADDQHHQFPNPLNYKNLTKRLAPLFGITGESAKIVPTNWTCEVPYTTIQFGVQARVDYTLGRVIFDEPQVIPCRKQFTTYVQFDGGKYLIQQNGMLTPRNVGRGQMMADRNFNPTGFWRHARAWIQCYYHRDLHYEYMFTDREGNAIPNTTFQAPDPNGGMSDYTARTSIHDGKLVIEVQKVWPGASEAGGTQFQTGNMVLQRAMTDYDATIETSLDDLYKMTLPTVVNAEPKDLETYKRNVKHLDFPRARMFKMDMTTPGEIQAEMAGYVTADYASSITRPKVFSWRLRDDRSRLLARAVRELEMSNNIIVSGTMRLVGVVHDVIQGMGYVDKPGKGKAVVKRAQYSFTDGLQVEIEISREEARFGEIVPKEADMMHNIQKSVLEQGRVIDALRAAQAAQANQANPQSNTTEVGSSAVGVYRGS